MPDVAAFDVLMLQPNEERADLRALVQHVSAVSNDAAAALTLSLRAPGGGATTATGDVRAANAARASTRKVCFCLLFLIS